MNELVRKKRCAGHAETPSDHRGTERGRKKRRDARGGGTKGVRTSRFTIKRARQYVDTQSFKSTVGFGAHSNDKTVLFRSRIYRRLRNLDTNITLSQLHT